MTAMLANCDPSSSAFDGTLLYTYVTFGRRSRRSRGRTGSADTRELQPTVYATFDLFVETGTSTTPITIDSGTVLSPSSSVLTVDASVESVTVQNFVCNSTGYCSGLTSDRVVTLSPPGSDSNIELLVMNKLGDAEIYTAYNLIVTRLHVAMELSDTSGGSFLQDGSFAVGVLVLAKTEQDYTITTDIQGSCQIDSTLLIPSGTVANSIFNITLTYPTPTNTDQTCTFNFLTSPESPYILQKGVQSSITTAQTTTANVKGTMTSYIADATTANSITLTSVSHALECTMDYLFTSTLFAPDIKSAGTITFPAAADSFKQALPSLQALRNPENASNFAYFASEGTVSLSNLVGCVTDTPNIVTSYGKQTVTITMASSASVVAVGDTIQVTLVSPPKPSPPPHLLLTC